jgi:hypothetical protein
MDSLYAICRDRNAYAQIVTNHKNDFSLIMELFPHLKHISEEVSHWFKSSSFPHYLFPEKCRFDYAVARRDDVFWILDGNKKAVVMSLGESKIIDNELYWFYAFSGLHEGEPIKIAVKDPHPDWDENSWTAIHDGMFFGDDLSKPVCDVLSEWYDLEFSDILRADISQSWG